MNKEDILRQYFGYSAFRPGQETLIDALLSGQDVLGVMPTGGGKSLCYQIPALMLPGITLVVSPLISLMKDQVMSLKSAGVSAAYINSSLSTGQLGTVFHRTRSGAYKIIYIAPERLQTDEFLSVLENIPVSMVAVDEAHCISQWGQDFRPSYLKIAAFIEALPCRPVIAAFTATATERVRQDIVNALKLQRPLELITGFDRPNLFFDVLTLTPKNKLMKLRRLLAERSEKSGIIYCSTRKQVDELCATLEKEDISVTKYHAGLSEEERHANQDAFVYDRARVMVATNAFGMGIDKSNVSFVIHYNMPKSLEEYYQEAGRAGRDGTPADCILLYSGSDVITAKFLIEKSAEKEELSEDAREQHLRQQNMRLDRMIGYCKTTSCLRGCILGYFGQKHDPTCDRCGNCCAALRETDITEEARMILSCVRRVIDRLHYPVGVSLLSQVLMGSSLQRVRDLGLDTLSTYGIMKNHSRQDLRELFDALEAQGLIEYNEPYHAVLTTASARAVLFADRRVTMRTRAPEKSVRSTVKGSAPEASPELFNRLRDLRARLAHDENVPAYVIFSNAALTDMAAKQPTTLNGFLAVSGVGAVKAERYGEAFLGEIRAWKRKEK